MYALHTLNESSFGLSSMLRVLEEKLVSCSDTFDGQAISNALYGLKNMNLQVDRIESILLAIQVLPLAPPMR